MEDKLSPTERSKHMARIRGRDTRPEMAVRRLLHSLGYRYRLHFKGIPGRPDIAFPGRRKAIFVHGCFWHGHQNCKVAHIPRTRSDYWASKFARNQARDERQQRELRDSGWQVLIIWECEISQSMLADIQKNLVEFLGSTQS